MAIAVISNAVKIGAGGSITSNAADFTGATLYPPFLQNSQHRRVALPAKLGL